MCEILGFCGGLPNTATTMLRRFAARGGLDGRTLDGWGVTLYDGNDARSYREPEPAAASAWLEFIGARPIPAHLMIAHIRHATRGGVALGNTQPFVREIGGRIHCFAHNGHLESMDRHLRALRGFRPIGDTDSEIAACVLFDRMARLWSSEGTPALSDRLSVAASFAAEMRLLGPANFLYSDGITLFAHGHRRRQASGAITAPGLWRSWRGSCLDRHQIRHAAAGVGTGSPPESVTLIASVPLDEACWEPLGEGEILAIEENGSGLRTAGRAAPRSPPRPFVSATTKRTAST